MSLYAIADLHLSFAKEKPMDIFGDIWKNHSEKIRERWLEAVRDEDTVLVAGDISWATAMEDAKEDMAFLKGLPGRKIMIQGNHDYWWDSASKVRKEFPCFTFLRNDYAAYGDYAVCGSRGWLCPNDTYYTSQDEKLYKREANRLRMSVEAALRAGYENIILMMHYPPTNDNKESSAFTDLIQEYAEIKKVVYGHLHGENSFDASLKGEFGGREFFLVSADYLHFKPVKIMD